MLNLNLRNKFSIVTIFSILMLNSIVGFGSENCKSVFVDTQVKSFPKVNETSGVCPLFTHGRLGSLLINGEWKNAQQIASFLQSKFESTSQDFQIRKTYGCEFVQGAGAIGKNALKYLGQELQIKISASTNISGKDDNCVLEGTNNSDVLAFENHLGNLQTCAGIMGVTYLNDDLDRDVVCNSLDIVDDSDVILNRVEESSCYYKAAEISLLSAVMTRSTKFEGLIKNVYDNILTKTHSFISKDLSSKIIYEETPIRAVAITSLNIAIGTSIFASTNKVIVKNLKDFKYQESTS